MSIDSRLMEKSPNIVICGNYGATNIGDEAILDGILAMVREARPDATITVMGANPAETAHLHEVLSVPLLPSGVRSFFRAVFKKGFVRTARAIKNCDLFILGGGGLFNDEKPRAILIWALQAFFALALKKPLFCLGQSIGPLRRALARHIVRKIFVKAKLISVRDKSSKQILEALDPRIADVHVLADPVFALNTSLEPASHENFVVFSIRPWKQKNHKHQLKILARFIDWIYETYQYRILLVPFQVLNDNDFDEFDTLRDFLKYPQAVQNHEYSPDYKKTWQLISRARATVGMRLHSLIFSTMTKTPFLALSYSEKVDSFVREMGLQNYLVDWKKFDFEMLQNKFMAVLANRANIQAELAEKKAAFRNLAEENVDLLQKILAEEIIA